MNALLARGSMPHPLSEFITERRRVLRMSRETVAENATKAGHRLSASYLSKLENGDPKTKLPPLPSLRKITALAVGLQVEESVIMGFLGDLRPSSGRQEGSNHAVAMVSRFPTFGERPENGATAASAMGSVTNLTASERTPEGIPSGDTALDPRLRPIPAGDAHWKALHMFEYVNCGDSGYLAPDTASGLTVWPRSIAGDADAELHVRGDSMKGLGYEEGTVLLVRTLAGEIPSAGAEVIVRIADNGLICKVLRKDAQGYYLESAPGNTSEPWRRALGPEDKILAEVVALVNRRRRG